MSVVLTVYSEKAFKKYLLPAVENTDYRLSIQGELFGIPSDTELAFENIDGRWKILPDSKWRITRAVNNSSYSSDYLWNGDVLLIEMTGGVRISLIVEQTESCFYVYKKYDLANVQEITIGKDEKNHFCFNSYGLVSKDHARIVRKGNGFVIQDCSANGTFVNARRVIGSRQLGYGDCIDIFGLRIVYFDRFIAVDSHVGTQALRDPELAPFRIAEYYEKPTAITGKSIFHRSPRNMPNLDMEKIEIDSPPAPREQVTQPILMTIGPSLTMTLPMLMGCAISIYSTRLNGGTSGVFMYTGLVTAIGSALVGTMWAIVNILCH